MPVGPTSGRRRGTLASGKIAHHTYSVKGDPDRAVITLESSADLDLLVNRDGSKPYPGKADLTSRSADGSEEVAVENLGEELGVGVSANEAGDYELAMTIEGGGRGDDGSEEDGGEDGDDGSNGEDGDSDDDAHEKNPGKPDQINKLTLKSNTNERTTYTIDVTDEIEFIRTDTIVASDVDTVSNDRANDTVTLPDSIDGTDKVTGMLRQDKHVFAFTGELIDYQLSGSGWMAVNEKKFVVSE